MRLLRRHSLVGVASLLAGVRAASAQAHGRLDALIVGIDGYEYLRKLEGCLNDARLIEAAVRPVANSVTVLPERQATRTAFLRAWDRLIAAARPGDTLLITFSGHGGQTPELIKGNEADGLDENLFMRPFHPRAPNNAERIIDDELGERFARTGARGIRSIFLADCCHSGGATRRSDPRAELLGYRSAGKPQIEDDLLAAISFTPSEPAGQLNLLFIAAGQENELVPELRINGQPHGATSYAFAEIFARATATGRFPGTDAFGRDVVSATRALAGGRHHPLVDNQLPAGEPLLPTRAPAVVATSPSSGRGRVRLHVLPGSGQLVDAARAADGVTLVADRAQADALLDPSVGELVSGSGDLLAVELYPEALTGALEKLRSIALVAELRLATMEVGLLARGETLAPGGVNSVDRLLLPGEEFDLVIRSVQPAAVVAISLAADGVMRVLTTPHAASVLTARDRVQAVRVRPPPGAIHVLSVAASEPIPDLHAALLDMDRARAPLAATRLMLQVRNAQALGLLGLHIDRKGSK